MRFQKAQAIVEFAIVLPLFLMFLVGLIYFGFFFADYLTVSNTTRNIAHEVALSENPNVQEIINQKTAQVTLISDVFVWKPNESKYLNVGYSSDGKDVVVKSHLDYSSSSYFGKIMKSVNKFSANKNGIDITYTMYRPSGSGP
ncbi:TadE/TadG family type IV pilus assembly protein [Anaerovibrio sp. RM50]|uniref:TadE/TadG family type IV pilus assembly protein n=1 Tax=Anaerovibrio sp. RM50 TaxID=1200557 RepID=UPI00047FF15B|nr:TadE family protein [Anaerovibrio sp. RM50]